MSKIKGFIFCFDDVITDTVFYYYPVLSSIKEFDFKNTLCITGRGTR